jgi:hypothetical protein
MATTTKRISFNVTNRHRKFRGQNRNFDTAALAALINGGETQEKVKHRDMLGYFGHWPRVRFGMNPGEGAILDGKHVSIEPAIVTTHLKALPDGTIEHETEFLDTASGRLAERLYLSNAGGFSSAIDTRKCGDKQVPLGFYGFDYVLEPNFTKNRGYDVALDGVQDEAMLMMLDDVAEYRGMFDAINGLYDSLQGAYDLQSAAMQRVVEENETLMSMLAKQGRSPHALALDGIEAEAFGGGESRVLRVSDRFMATDIKDLPGFQALDSVAEEERKAEEKAKPTDNLLHRMFR